MRAIVALLLIAVAPLAHAKCHPKGGDAADVAAARAAVASKCDCAGAATHDDYVSCAQTTAQAVLRKRSCLGAVVRCAVHSTCGMPGSVVCCRGRSHGRKRSMVLADADQCRPSRDKQPWCVSTSASTCDACDADNCTLCPNTHRRCFFGSGCCPGLTCVLTPPGHTGFCMDEGYCVGAGAACGLVPCCAGFLCSSSGYCEPKASTATTTTVPE